MNIFLQNMNLPGFYPEKFINSSSQSSSALTTLTHCLCGWFVAFASKQRPATTKRPKNQDSTIKLVTLSLT